MIGSLDPRHREVTIVGAGVAGMLVAYQLDRAGFEVTLLEEKERAGGMIQTDRTPWGIAESAAHSTLATQPVLELCADLGVELLQVRENSKARYIFREGKLRNFPLRFGEAMTAIGRSYFVMADKSVPSGEMTLEQWSERFLGGGVRDYLIGPFVAGIYGARPSDLWVNAAFPSLAVPHGHSLLSHQISRAFRGGEGRKKGPRARMMVPRNGMGELVGKLEERLQTRLGSRFRKGVRIDALPSVPNLILAVPAYAAAELLVAHDSNLVHALREIRYTPLMATTTFVARSGLPKDPRGVGALIPEREGHDCLGVLFNSSAFASRVEDEKQWSSFTVMMGGAAAPEWLDASNEKVEEAIRRELGLLFGLGSDAEIHCITRRWKQAIPQYNQAIAHAWQTARSGWARAPGRLLFGNYTGQVSLRGMIETSAAMAAGLHHDALTYGAREQS